MCLPFAVMIGAMVVRSRDLNPDSKTAQLRPHPISPLTTNVDDNSYTFTMESIRNAFIC